MRFPEAEAYVDKLTRAASYNVDGAFRDQYEKLDIDMMLRADPDSIECCLQAWKRAHRMGWVQFVVSSLLGVAAFHGLTLFLLENFGWDIFKSGVLVMVVVALGLRVAPWRDGPFAKEVCRQLEGYLSSTRKRHIK
jgi:hypothetical protein